MDSPSIAIGLDFSSAAVSALAEARKLAAALGARLEIVHVTEAGDEGAGERAGEYGCGEDELVIRTGVPWIELTRYVRQRKPVMLVVGSHGRSGFHPLGPGSTAARLAASAPCPILIVSPGDAR